MNWLTAIYRLIDRSDRVDDPVSQHAQYRNVLLLLRWLFGDVVFAILPIVTIAVITAAVSGSFEGFALIKEWSFATIVLYGVSIRRLMKLKIEVQLASRTPELDVGVQFYVLLVIVSVVVLGLVVLGELKEIVQINHLMLEVLQMSLFSLSLVSVLITAWHEEYWLEVVQAKSATFQTQWFLRYAKVQSDEAFVRINRLNSALEMSADQLPRVREDAMSRRKREKTIAETAIAIDRVRRALEDAAATIARLEVSGDHIV